MSKSNEYEAFKEYDEEQEDFSEDYRYELTDEFLAEEMAEEMSDEDVEEPTDELIKEDIPEEYAEDASPKIFWETEADIPEEDWERYYDEMAKKSATNNEIKEDVPVEDEIPDERFEEEMTEGFTEGSRQDLKKEISGYEREISKIDWTEYIEQMEDTEKRDLETSFANEIVQDKKALWEQVDSGEIPVDIFKEKYSRDILSKERSAITRSFLGSKGVHSFDHDGFFEGWEGLEENAVRMSRKEQDTKSLVETTGEDAVQELTERMLKGGRISKETHDAIMQQLEHEE